MKKTLIFFLLLNLVIGSFFVRCLAITLLTEREALKFIFSSVDEIVTNKKTLSDSQIEKVKKRLGGKLVTNPKGMMADKIIEQREFNCYVGIKEKKAVGVAFILVEPGHWGPITFIVQLDMGGKVQNIAVMKYTETRGRPIVRRNFLAQFIGKTSKDLLTLEKNLNAISGATVSSKATAFIVKKAIILFEELYL